MITKEEAQRIADAMARVWPHSLADAVTALNEAGLPFRFSVSTEGRGHVVHVEAPSEAEPPPEEPRQQWGVLITEYPEEGCMGPYGSREEAEAAARANLDDDECTVVPLTDEQARALAEEETIEAERAARKEAERQRDEARAKQSDWQRIAELAAEEIQAREAEVVRLREALERFVRNYTDTDEVDGMEYAQCTECGAKSPEGNEPPACDPRACDVGNARRALAAPTQTADPSEEKAEPPDAADLVDRMLAARCGRWSCTLPAGHDGGHECNSFLLDGLFTAAEIRAAAGGSTR